ncbi:MAG: helix-turn-helix domain-containing protein [Candidatus Paceibacterota bacterium]
MSLTELKTLKETLKDEMRAQGISVLKLSELTDIAPHHITALMESDFEHLPASPYVHGYILKIAEILELDADVLWRRYSRENDMKKSGEKDTLPKNRFALRSIKKSSLFISALVVLVLVIGLPVIADFFGKPSLEVISPAGDTEIVTEKSYTVSGTIQNPKDRVFINQTEVPVTDDGTFQIQKDLDEGANTFTISTKRFLGGETTITRNVFYKSTDMKLPESVTSSPAVSDTPTTSSETPSVEQ